jgi:hypothetical protein
LGEGLGEEGVEDVDEFRPSEYAGDGAVACRVGGARVSGVEGDSV